MALVNITKHLMVALTPVDQGLIMRGLSELPAKESRDILNRLESLILRNEMPEPPVPEPAQLKPVSESIADAARDANAAPGTSEP
jgi:hypothetical protein